MALIYKGLLLVSIVGISFAADLSYWRKPQYYGKQEVKDGQTAPTDNTEVRPFNISIADSDLADIKNRLANARFIDHIPGTAFHYGMDSEELINLVKYWNGSFDWRAQEEKLNKASQFKTQIEGIDVHFVHVKASSKATKVFPLLSVHGWPSSFLEIYKALPMLTEPDESGLAFEVIAPSIPGYGYSEGAHKTGLDPTAAGRMFATLMTERLGFDKYFLQGNDWGSIITRNIAILYPEHVLGIHVLGLFDPLENLLNPKRLARNLVYPHIPDLDPAQWKRDYEKLFPLKKTLLEAFEETGVMHLMMTKPDTLSSALVDTPVGMAAHVLEKLSSFTNKANRDRDDGGLRLKYNNDQLLTLVMIYYTTPSVAATSRLYKEFILSNSTVTAEVIKVPAGLVDTEHEMIRSPKALAEANYAKLVQYTDLRDGGHLMFFEEPKMIVDDLRVFVHKVTDRNQSIIDRIKDRLSKIN